MEKTFEGSGYLVDKNNHYIERNIVCMMNDKYISLTDGEITIMVEQEAFIKKIDEELIPDIDDRKIYLELRNLKTGKTFKKYFRTEFEKDKFKRKLRYSSNLTVISDPISEMIGDTDGNY